MRRPHTRFSPCTLASACHVHPALKATPWRLHTGSKSDNGSDCGFQLPAGEFSGTAPKGVEAPSRLHHLEPVGRIVVGRPAVEPEASVEAVARSPSGVWSPMMRPSPCGASTARVSNQASQASVADMWISAIVSQAASSTPSSRSSRTADSAKRNERKANCRPWREEDHARLEAGGGRLPDDATDPPRQHASSGGKGRDGKGWGDSTMARPLPAGAAARGDPRSSPAKNPSRAPAGDRRRRTRRRPRAFWAGASSCREASSVDAVGRTPAARKSATDRRARPSGRGSPRRSARRSSGPGIDRGAWTDQRRRPWRPPGKLAPWR